MRERAHETQINSRSRPTELGGFVPGGGDRREKIFKLSIVMSENERALQKNATFGRRITDPFISTSLTKNPLSVNPPTRVLDVPPGGEYNDDINKKFYKRARKLITVNDVVLFKSTQRSRMLPKSGQAFSSSHLNASMENVGGNTTSDR